MHGDQWYTLKIDSFLSVVFPFEQLEQREQHRKEQIAALEMQQRIAAEQAERLKIERVRT